MKATGEFNVSGWEQADLEGIFTGKSIMKVDAVFDVSGEMNGRFSVAYLMHYLSPSNSSDQHDATAQYVGYLAFEGKIGDREGSFILQDCGAYANSVPSSVFSVVGNSGTKDLTGISGNGKYYAQDGKMVIELEYTF